MIDFKDVTFGINIRFTTEDRKRNIKLVLEYILKYFDTNIIVAEEDKESHFPEVSETINGWGGDNCDYIFMESDKEYMNKTKAFNQIFYRVKTPIYVLQDADVICSPEMYLEAANRIRKRRCDFCYSFDGRCHDVGEELVAEFAESLDYGLFTNENTHRFSTQSPGGSIFIDSQVYTVGGMDNENMKAWGYDDDERVSRFRKLGFKVDRVEGTLYHLTHERTVNSKESHYTQQNMIECMRINRLTTGELIKEIKTWSWVKK